LSQDTVYLASPSSSQGYTRVSGTVSDYSSAGVVIDTGGKARTFPVEQVTRIETHRVAAHTQADGLYEANDFAGAVGLYRQAREQESRPWVRRQITAQMVRCYGALGQATAAVEQFLLLIRTDAATPHFDCIPLAWFSSFQSPALEQAARSWLRQESMPAAVLLGASYLLQTEHGGAALKRLHGLANGEDETIAQLARAQSWRMSLISADADQVAQWQATVDAMRPELRAGAYYVIGQGWSRTGQWEKAALAMMRIPVLYPQERQLSARALIDAGSALAKLDRPRRAGVLYAELIRDYPESPLVAEAESRLESVNATQP